MTIEISDTLISELSDFVNSRTGLHFPKEKWRDLKRNIRAAAPDLGFTNAEACIGWILSTPLTKEQINIIVGHLTIGETFFFRDRPVFDALRDHILTPWARFRDRGEKRLRIWSSACATGEEPYSIAIVLDEMSAMFRGWKIAILATDINSRFLEKARKGVYTQWSFRDMPDRLMARYFTKTGKNRYEIASHIKKMVSFSQLNLVEEGPVSLPGGVEAVDIIFCRNALMYLSPDMRTRVMSRLARTLTDDGWLIVSPSETAFVQVPELHPVRMSSVIFHQKGSPEGATKSGAQVAFPSLTSAKKGQPPKTVAPPPVQAIPSLKLKRTPSAGSLPLKRGEAVDGDKGIYQEALTLYEKGRYGDAVHRLDAFLSDGAVSADTHLSEMTGLLAKAYANLGRLEEARRWGEKAISLDKLNPDHYSMLAAIYQEMGLKEEPIAALKRAIYLDPDRVMAHFLLGHLMKRQGKADEAKRSFGAALDLLLSMHPDETVPHSEGLRAGRLRETIQFMMEGD